MTVPQQPLTASSVPAPRMASSPLTASAVLNAEPNDPFVLVHYPMSPTAWQVETRGTDRPVLLPAFSPVLLVEGAFGIRTTGPGEDPQNKFDTMYSILRKNGGVLIPDAGAHAYMAITDCRGGVYHHPKWTQPEQPLMGQMVTPKVDHAAYVEWRIGVVKAGLVPPPSQSVLDTIRASLQGSLASTIAETAMEPQDVRDRRVGAAQARLDAFRNALRPWEPEASDEAPKMKRGAA